MCSKGVQEPTTKAKEGKRQLTWLNTCKYLLLLAEPEVVISSVCLSMPSAYACAFLGTFLDDLCVAARLLARLPHVHCARAGACVPACSAQAVLWCVPACLPARGLAETCHHPPPVLPSGIQRVPGCLCTSPPNTSMYLYARTWNGMQDALCVAGLAAFLR